MNVQASAGRSSSSLLTHCENLKLTTKNAEEAGWMAALYRVIIFGGELEMRQKDGEKLVVEFCGVSGTGGES